MRTFKVKVQGVTPYMQHRMDDRKLADWERQRGRIVENDLAGDEPHRLAMFHSYIDDNGHFYIPAEHFKQCMIKGAGYVKAKVGSATKSMKSIVAGMWMIKEQKLPFRPFDEVDSRSAVNRAVKARIMTHRPKWNDWSAEFTLLIDDDEKGKVTEETIRAIIEYGGRYLGVGSYRPEHTGEFGRFRVESLELVS